MKGYELYNNLFFFNKFKKKKSNRLNMFEATLLKKNGKVKDIKINHTMC